MSIFFEGKQLRSQLEAAFPTMKSVEWTITGADCVHISVTLGEFATFSAVVKVHEFLERLPGVVRVFDVPPLQGDVQMFQFTTRHQVMLIGMAS